MERTQRVLQRITNFIRDNDLLIDVKSLELGSKINEGSTSSVQQGWYNGNQVAVKKMQPTVGSPVGSDLLRKFFREVTLLHQGRHENVVSLIGASVEPEFLIVTELMQGGSLKTYLWNMRPGCPDLQQSVRFALDISRALQHLHGLNIIHRDLKPGNLVLAADQGSLKVADFGISQEGNNIKHMIYETGNMRWTAPELITKIPETLPIPELAFTHKVDIFSFSIVLWELLTNKTPPSETKNRPSLEELPDSVPMDLIHLLKRCWAEEPDMRPEFNEIIVKLTEIFNGLPNH